VVPPVPAMRVGAVASELKNENYTVGNENVHLLFMAICVLFVLCRAFVWKASTIALGMNTHIHIYIYVCVHANMYIYIYYTSGRQAHLFHLALFFCHTEPFDQINTFLLVKMT